MIVDLAEVEREMGGEVKEEKARLDGAAVGIVQRHLLDRRRGPGARDVPPRGRQIDITDVP